MRVIAEDVGFRYGSRQVLTGVDLDLPTGEIGIVVGPSGSGKSTLLALLSGLRKPQRGRVWVAPGRVAGVGAPRPPDPGDVAWVPQGLGALPARTALENTMLGALPRGAPLEEATATARSCLGRVGLAARAGDPCGRLSGGEQQRVALARALATGRPLLFADEPTSHLDAASTARVIEAVTSLRAHATVVIATHDPALMSVSPHVLRLRDGTDDAAR